MIVLRTRFPCFAGAVVPKTGETGESARSVVIGVVVLVSNGTRFIVDEDVFMVPFDTAINGMSVCDESKKDANNLNHFKL